MTTVQMSTPLQLDDLLAIDDDDVLVVVSIAHQLTSMGCDGFQAKETSTVVIVHPYNNKSGITKR